MRKRAAGRPPRWPPPKPRRSPPHGLTGGKVFAGPVPARSPARWPKQAAAGTLAVDVITVLPFERAADGLATIARGQARGKIVVTVAD